MSFKYINPGYANLGLSNCTQQTANATYNPYNNHVYFTNSDSVCMDVSSTELWFKQGMYGRTGEYMLFYGSNGNTGIKIAGSLIYWHTKGTNHDAIGSLAAGMYHEIMIHSKISNTQSENALDVWLDGDKIYSGSNYAYLGTSDKITGIEFLSGGYNSNIIISDTEISPIEKVAIITPASTNTDMTSNGDGTYTSTAAGQTILQTVDKSALITQAGNDNVTITGVGVAGNPAYYEGTGLNTLTSVSKSGDVVTEHNPKTLTNTATAGILDSWADSMTLSQLAAMSFGWKSGA